MFYKKGKLHEIKISVYIKQFIRTQSFICLPITYSRFPMTIEELSSCDKEELTAHKDENLTI